MFSLSAVSWILLVLASVATMLFLERLFELRRAHINCDDFVDGAANLLSHESEDEALAICAETRAPIAAIVATAVRQRHAPARVLRESVDAQGRMEVSRMDRRIASIAIIGQVAPLVGLLGTVIGFVKALMVANSNVLVSRPELFSAATEAMVSAALGLAVMIIASIMYGLLRVRIERIVVDLESATSKMLGFIAMSEARK